MSFFVTSVNPGKGGDLGGLEGADAYCASLAEAAGVTGRVWRAYLSSSRRTPGTGSAAALVERQGRGDRRRRRRAARRGNNISKATALDEKGNIVNGRGDEPNRHDILTGSNPDGTATADTCADWTSGTEGAATVGHHDRMGLDKSAEAKSWNSSHASRGGCSIEAFNGTGGDGLFYCFAAE